MRLDTNEIGRIVFSDGSGVNVLPVNYAPGPDHIVVIRSAAGAKLRSAQRDRQAVAFHTDGLETPDTAWWVTLVGHFDEVLDLTEIPGLTRLEVDPWADDVAKPHFLRLRPVKVSGGTTDLGPPRTASITPPGADGATEEPQEVVFDRGGLEILGPDECRQLLGTAQMGRLAFLFAGFPSVVPARPVMTSSDIIVRARPDLVPVLPTQSAAFQIDSFDAQERTGWSVLVKGNVERVTDAAEVGPVETALLGEATGHPDQWVRLRPREITGRRIPARN